MVGMGFNLGGFVSENNTLKQLPIDVLVPRHNHKFALYEGERLNDMVESVKENGVMTPIIVLQITKELIANLEKELAEGSGELAESIKTAINFYNNNIGNYEILAGHNRYNASKLAKIEFISGIVKTNLTYAEAEMYVVETNLMQRGIENLKISERASAIATRHSALFSEEKRKSIEEELKTLDTNGMVTNKEKSSGKSKLALAGQDYGLSKDTVARLIRINKLTDELKEYVDDSVIAIRPAVQLSYLKISEQNYVNMYMPDKGIDTKTASLLRRLSESGNLTESSIEEILNGTYYDDNSSSDSEEKEKKKKSITIKLDMEFVEKYLSTEWDKKQIEEYVIDCIKLCSDCDEEEFILDIDETEDGEEFRLD